MVSLQNARIPLKDPSLTPLRKAFIGAVTGSFVMLQILFFVNLCYLYGVLYKGSHRVHNLKVLMVDYDEGIIGQSLRSAYTTLKADSFPTIVEGLPVEYTNVEEAEDAVCRGDYWAALYVNANASQQLDTAIQGTTTSETYNPSTALTLVWDQIRYATISESDVLLNIQNLVAVAKAEFPHINNSSILRAVNVTNTAALQALLDPFEYSTINLGSAPQSARYLLNTASVVMFTLMQFFFILAFNGISTGFGFYTRIPVLTHVSIRFGVSLLYALVGALLSVAYIWIFSETWALDGGQFMSAWMVLWLDMHINFLVLDAVIATIPITFVPFVTFTWIILNIASTVMPFDVSVGFYKLGYLFPAHSLWEVFIQIWSGGCYNRLYRTLPILFVWEVVAFPIDIFCQYRKAAASAASDLTQENIVTSNGSPGPELVLEDMEIPDTKA